MMDSESLHPIKTLADYVSLLYHEARNVRHLIRGGHLSARGWERIVSLPRNRNVAWGAIQRTRHEASEASTASELLSAFEIRFGVSLHDLQVMFEDQNWKHARLYGGNAWARIAEDVIELADAIEGEDTIRQEFLISRLEKARHNTGKLYSKLLNLDSMLPDA